MSEGNILPMDFRKKVFCWCGSGTIILITYRRAGLYLEKVYETVKDFLNAIHDLDDILVLLKSVN